MLFVPTLLAFAGLILCASIALWVVRGGVFALSGNAWAERWGATSFITYSWHELGRALALGLVAAAGTAPMAFAFFAGSERALANIFFLTGLAWASYAAGIFLIGILTGLVGFLRYEHQSYQRRAVFALLQILVVGVAVLPVFLVFVRYLVPTLSMVIGLWLQTMGLYARIAAA
ncbi:MAG: hypothetical protein U1E87_07020 [Alphaproteobacteria bacterium]